jgi:drug/metabolite transporter (DMT)-like permease
VRLHPAFVPLSLTAIVWGLNFVVVKWAYAELSAPALALSRLFPALLVMAICTVLTGERLSYPKGDALKILSLGFFATGVYMITFLEGMRTSSPADASILLSTSPIIAYGVAVAFGRESFRWGAFFGSVIAFVGVGLVVFGAGSQTHGKLLGNLLILFSAVQWALCVVFGRPLLEKYSPIRVFTLSMPGALIVLAPYGLSAALHTNWLHLAPLTWLSFWYIAVLAGALGFAGFYLGVSRASASGAMLAQFCVPPIAAVSGWVLLKERLTLVQIAGFVIVACGLWTSFRARRVYRSIT